MSLKFAQNAFSAKDKQSELSDSIEHNNNSRKLLAADGKEHVFIMI